MRRRDFTQGIAGAAVLWPLAGRAQQTALPVVGFLRNTRKSDSIELARAFQRGLRQAGYAAGENVTIEYRWTDGQQDRVPSMLAELVKRPVAVLVVGGTNETRAARAATSSILEQHALILGHVRISFGHQFLNRQRALDGGHDGRELNQHAVAHCLENPAAMAGQDRINGCPVLAQSLGRAGLIQAHQPAVPSYIGGQDGSQFAGRVHALSRSAWGDGSAYHGLDWVNCPWVAGPPVGTVPAGFSPRCRWSAFGTKLPSADVRAMSAIEGNSDQICST
jgi:hypothetical protein